jgi:FkbM family methyltransferase
MKTPAIAEVPIEKRAIFERLSGGSRQPVYVLGRNKYAESVARAIAVEGFVDDYTSDKEFNGKPVVQMAQLPKGCVVVSCVVDGRPVTAVDRLRQANVADVIDYFTLTRLAPESFHALDFSAHNHDDIVGNADKYRWLYSRLGDELSRFTLERVTQFRLTWDLEQMRGFAVELERQYFEDFVVFRSGEVFVDGGGYDGQTSLRFAARCPHYKHIYCFEPNPRSAALVKSALQGLENLSFVSKGLSNFDGAVRFDGHAGSASRISDGGAENIPVVRLDDEVREPVTFFKLDVEGAECEALLGAEEHIRADRPKLAVCVYHDQRDFWRVPELVLGMNDAYDVYLRHYTQGIFETVMYFIPRL